MELSDKVELIDLPVTGISLCLLRPRLTPEFAFVMWVDRDSGTYSQMVLRNTGTGKHADEAWHSRQAYLVVCACCGVETYGFDFSPFESNKPEYKDSESYKREWKKWQASEEGQAYASKEKQLAEAFKKAIVESCQKNGITTIFMRRAEAWNNHYGKAENLAVVESADGINNAMLELYGRKVIEKALSFIDSDRSSGLEF
jgi:hypothetical protein